MVEDLAGKSVAIVGMARSGMAAAEFLWKRGARVTLSDSRPTAALESEIRILNERNIRYEVGGHSMELFDSADLIVVSPGVPLSLPVLRHAAQTGRSAGTPRRCAAAVAVAFHPASGPRPRR